MKAIVGLSDCGPDALPGRNQRHACGTGDRDEVLRNRPDELVELYGELERYVKSLGPVEFVTRERYVLLRHAANLLRTSTS
jgi:hypothetical protein